MAATVYCGCLSYRGAAVRPAVRAMRVQDGVYACVVVAPEYAPVNHMIAPNPDHLPPTLWQAALELAESPGATLPEVPSHSQVARLRILARSCRAAPPSTPWARLLHAPRMHSSASFRRQIMVRRFVCHARPGLSPPTAPKKHCARKVV